MSSSGRLLALKKKAKPQESSLSAEHKILWGGSLAHPCRVGCLGLPRGTVRMRMVDMKKVMVVEDDADTLELLGTLLSDAGYQPVLLPRSDGVPERVISEQPDVILLDILLEPKHGMEVLASISDLEPRPPVILISAAVKGVRQMEQIARALGCYAFVEKPFDLDELLRAVRGAMAERQAAA